jgi:2-polyprenyl-6-methoxyphenol hydroxylase-like FAD-dependent oxidoreductase
MRVLICGAGIGGLALALMLGRLGCETEVVERASGVREEGYMIDFFGPGFEAAEAMGLLPRLRQVAYPVDELNYVDRNGRPRASLDYQRIARSLDGRLLSLLRGDLARTIYEDLGGPVKVRFDSSVREVEQTPYEVLVTLSDGRLWSGDLLVGADGIHSRIRGLVFGAESTYLRYLGFHTAAYTFADDVLRDRLGDQFAITDSVDRAVGLYAIRNGRVAVFTVHRTADAALPKDPRAAIQSMYADRGWLVPEALTHCPSASALYYDQVSQIEMPNWTRGRVALLGDACQAVSLLASQGASLAVAAAHVLATELGRTPTVPQALARYQNRLASVVAEKQAAGRRTAQWFLPTSPGRLALRRLALRAMRLRGLDHLIGGQLVAGGGGIP